jgi:tripartite-type tricarboxylate transporter receptor subunit TctC
MTRILTGLGLLVLLSAAGSVVAEGYPARPIRLIVPNAPGSSNDVVNRIVAAKLGNALGQQVVVDNRAGAGGTIGMEIGARALPDGYTLVVGGPNTMILSKFVYKTLAYDSLKDFEPISLTVIAEGILAVNPGVPAKNVMELITLAKAQPGKLNMSSAGVGSSSHLSGLMFTSMAGIESVHVPYKGGGPMALAVIAGESQWLVGPAGSVVGYIKAGRLRALGITSKTRSPLLPELPTIDEAGVPGYEFLTWTGFLAPKRTPQPIINSLNATIRKALAESDTKQQYTAQGLQPLAGSASPEEFNRFIRADFERITKLVKISGIKPE